MKRSLALIVCLLALASPSFSLAQNVAKSTDDKEAIEKLVRLYIQCQGTPGEHDKMIDLCVQNATHGVIGVEAHPNRIFNKSIRIQIAEWKRIVTEEYTHDIDSVRVESFGAETSLAVALVEFHTGNINGRDLFNLTFVDGRWKVLSVVQQNRPR